MVSGRASTGAGADTAPRTRCPARARRYFKGTYNGVKNWTAMPSVFPNGLAALHNELKLGFVAHNRYWSADTGARCCNRVYVP